MMTLTKIAKASPQAVREAASLIREGRLVAFPTETVYGLGANALDAAAVAEIFSAKGRPADNPLIMHIADRAQLEGLVTVPDRAEMLMARFWPGPLTLLMPRTEKVPDIVTAGLETVAVRMPSHPVALALLRACGVPVAAPSANRSGKPSPTTAEHVLRDMDGRIPLILDGGACSVGVESTVLDLCHGKPCILRPGGVTREMLTEVLGEVEVAGSVLRPLGKNEVARSPGMRYRHYAPEGSITLVTGAEGDVIRALRLLASDDRSTCILCFSEHMEALRDCRPHDLGSMHRPEETAARLFAILRRLDDEGMTRIYSEALDTGGVGLAVMNRLGRAAAFRSIAASDVLSDPICESQSDRRSSHA